LVRTAYQLAVSVAMTQHRAKIKKIIGQSVASLYQCGDNIEKQKAFRGLNFRKWSTQRSKIQSEYPFVLSADISRFFYTVYTHSIPWAVIGKDKAKQWNLTKNPKLSAHWSNDLDKAIQSCQSRETFGIPVGPDTSRVIAELLMAGIEDDDGFSPWLKKRSVIHLVDDFMIGFTRNEDAFKALGALRAALWKFNLQLNDEKTGVVPSRTPLKDKWEIEHERFFVSDISAKREATDISRLLELTLYFCAESRTDTPALLTCQRLSRLRHISSNFLLILDTLFRLAREFPRCTSHVAGFLINNQKLCGKNSHKERITKWVRATLNAHSIHGHDFEVAWCLVVCGALKIKVRKTDVQSEDRLPNSIVLALLGLLSERKLLTVPFSNWPWRAEFKKKGIYSHQWLPFYEAVLRKWTRDKKLVAAVSSDPILSKMLSDKVTFLEKRIFEAASINLTSRIFKPPKAEGPKGKRIKGFGDLIISALDLDYS
jgi:Reverse transcriptase (RNA-dependent DNA polymerase)